ncbi:MAG: sigma-54 dependent transcriptional regulator [Pyrinomonadaceae bacterium]
MTDEIKILLADDDPVLLELLPAQLSASGFLISTAATGREVLNSLKKEEFDVLLLDVNLPDASGIEILSAIGSAEDAPEVIMLTADKNLETGIEAMRRGAYDYLTKPAEAEEVKAVVRKAAEKQKLRTQNQKLRTAIRRQNENSAIKPVHASAVMKEIFEQAERVAGLDTTILITGESGTGKDVLANWMHSQGRRGDFPMISVNCGALPENLFESEFFGFEKGSFTGAGKQKIGLIEAADGSTLFLDEIGEMPLTMQVKLLHFLENGSFRRVGSNRDQKADVRVIAATNKDLPQEIAKGNFRSDLFYRINVISFSLPPLRERAGDIGPLIDFFLEDFRRSYNRPSMEISEKSRRELVNHAWPGNIRELRNTLERTVALSASDQITKIFGLPERGFESDERERKEFKPVALSELEKDHILKVLESVDGKRDRAAAILGITSRTLYRKLKEYNSQV